MEREREVMRERELARGERTAGRGAGDENVAPEGHGRDSRRRDSDSLSDDGEGNENGIGELDVYSPMPVDEDRFSL